MQVICRFEPATNNAVTKRRGRWRVVGCENFIGPVVARRVPRTRLLELTTIKRYPVGSYIVPHRALDQSLMLRGMIRNMRRVSLNRQLSGWHNHKEKLK